MADGATVLVLALVQSMLMLFEHLELSIRSRESIHIQNSSSPNLAVSYTYLNAPNPSSYPPKPKLMVPQALKNGWTIVRTSQSHGISTGRRKQDQPDLRDWYWVWERLIWGISIYMIVWIRTLKVANVTDRTWLSKRTCIPSFPTDFSGVTETSLLLLTPMSTLSGIKAQ